MPTPWWTDAKIYELYVDQFAGNFSTLASRMDYFVALGINCLHVLPHYPSPLVDDGYDVADYLSVRPDLGTLADFDAFVAAAKARNIRIITDLVLNHVSDQHAWFVEARTSQHNAKRDYFIWSDTGQEFAAATWFPDLKAGNWVFNAPTQDYCYSTFYAQQIDLNWDNPQVLREMLNIMAFWIERGVDGFRLDAVPYLIKREGSSSQGLPETHAIIKTIRRHLDQRYPRGIALMAEAVVGMRDVRAYFGEGDECQLVYHFPLVEQMWYALLTGDSAPMQALLQDARPLPTGCHWVTFLRNHDELSLAGFPATVRQSLVKMLDPQQDYVMKNSGMTAVRIANAVNYDPEKILAAMKLLYSTPGPKVMYYGDEIGMKNLPPDISELDKRRFVRGPFDWVEAQRQQEQSQSLWRRVVEVVKSS